MMFVLRCSCGWTHEATTRKSATMWKEWHRKQFTGKQQRLSESGHVVKISDVSDSTVPPDKTDAI